MKKIFEVNEEYYYTKTDTVSWLYLVFEDQKTFLVVDIYDTFFILDDPGALEDIFQKFGVARYKDMFKRRRSTVCLSHIWEAAFSDLPTLKPAKGSPTYAC